MGPWRNDRHGLGLEIVLDVDRNGVGQWHLITFAGTRIAKAACCELLCPADQAVFLRTLQPGELFFPTQGAQPLNAARPEPETREQPLYRQASESRHPGLYCSPAQTHQVTGSRRNV